MELKTEQLLVLIAIVSSTCGAATIFSNFGPGQSFNEFPAIGIAGSDAPLLGRNSLATSFSPSASATLDRIDLAIRSNGGTPTFTIEIADDSAGIPGTILETFSLSGIPSTTTIESVTSATHPLLSSGATYWV